MLSEIEDMSLEDIARTNTIVTGKKVRACEIMSNQAEINGTAEMKQVFGTGKKPIRCRLFVQSDSLFSCVWDGVGTWYDVREGSLRRSEYRLYIGKRTLQDYCEVDDSLIFGYGYNEINIFVVKNAPFASIPHVSNANQSGRLLEDTCERMLRSKGFAEVNRKDFYSKTDGLFYCRQLKYTTVEGLPGYSDFAIHIPKFMVNEDFKTEFDFSGEEESIRMRIECKRQVSAGSKDEAFKSTVENMQNAFPERNSIFLGHLPGVKTLRVDYLKKAMEERLYCRNGPKNVVFMELPMFVIWLIQGIHG